MEILKELKSEFNQIIRSDHSNLELGAILLCMSIITIFVIMALPIILPVELLGFMANKLTKK